MLAYTWIVSQVTIYVDEETAKRARAAARAEGLSLSGWIARLIQERTHSRWPEGFKALAGAWRDLPTAEEIRRTEGTDAEREPL
jgi:hypothetical protein